MRAESMMHGEDEGVQRTPAQVLKRMLAEVSQQRSAVCALTNRIAEKIVGAMTTAAAAEPYAQGCAGRKLVGKAVVTLLPPRDACHTWKVALSSQDAGQFVKVIAICQMTDEKASNTPCYGNVCLLSACMLYESRTAENMKQR